MIPILSAVPAPSFDHPLEMLRACHGKILRQCDTLQKLATHLVSHGCDKDAQQAAAGILRYFDTAGQFHHQDEEENLFPALRASAELPLLDKLLSEHEMMQTAWQALRPVLMQLTEGNNTTLDETLTQPFIAAYTNHIKLENTELLPLAARMLNSSQLLQLGQRMAERRGAKFP